MAASDAHRIEDQLSPDEREKYYLPSEVAAMFGVTPRTVANWCDRGLLQALVTPSGQRRVLASSLKGGRAYDAKKAAFAERMAHKRGDQAAPSTKTIVEAVQANRPVKVVVPQRPKKAAIRAEKGELETRIKRR